MNSWWQNIVKDYLTFTARERNGLIIMVVVCAAIYLSSRYLPVKENTVKKDAFQQELANLKIVVDSSRRFGSYERDENYADYARPKYAENPKYATGKLFGFDPNTLDATGWKRLGVREKTIIIIQHFLAKGYKFRQPEDIKKVYGLSAKEAERLMPFIHISQKEAPGNKDFTDRGKTVYPADNTATEIKKTALININTADTSAFIALPGIGNKLAARIVNFRQKLGGFSSVAQLGETYGIPDSTFQKIKPRLQCNAPALKTININTADINTLRAHPYLRWNIANAIINYRQQHGTYKSVEDIRKIDIITDELYNKIAPYLVI